LKNSNGKNGHVFKTEETTKSIVSYHKEITQKIAPQKYCDASICRHCNASNGIKETKVHFDTNSEPIRVKNQCTGCISHQIEDFDRPLVDSNRAIKGFGGSKTTNVKIGTINWKWLDNEGKSHKSVIPKSFCVASGNVHLFSPQHWAQNQHATKYGIGSETLRNTVTLFWNDCKNKLMIPLFHASPGCTRLR
jgi:ribosomal protein L40E